MNSLEHRKHRRENIILIADDDPITRQLLRHAIGDICKFVEVESGYAVLDYYQHYLPDLVLLDIHLPQKDGKLALQEILGFDRDAYVVMVSGDNTPTNIKQTKHSGAKGFISKPITRAAVNQYLLQCPTLALHDNTHLPTGSGFL